MLAASRSRSMIVTAVAVFSALAVIVGWRYVLGWHSSPSHPCGRPSYVPAAVGSALGVSALGLAALWSLNFEAGVRVAVTLALGALLGAVAMAVVIAIGYSCSY